MGLTKLKSGTIIIPDDIQNIKQEFIVTYARINSSDLKNSAAKNKSNLESQSKRLIDFCNARGWQTHLNIKEIGSGLDDNRKKLELVLKEAKATKLIVEHKDRLALFGVNYIKILCNIIGCELVIINNVETDKEDLIQDFVSVITSFCARLYGQRISKHKAEQLIKALESDEVAIGERSRTHQTDTKLY